MQEELAQFRCSNDRNDPKLELASSNLQQTYQGSFSAVSKPLLCDQEESDLQDLHASAPLHCFIVRWSGFLKISKYFAEK